MCSTHQRTAPGTVPTRPPARPPTLTGWDGASGPSPGRLPHRRASAGCTSVPSGRRQAGSAPGWASIQAATSARQSAFSDSSAVGGSRVFYEGVREAISMQMRPADAPPPPRHPPPPTHTHKHARTPRCPVQPHDVPARHPPDQGSLVSVSQPSMVWACLRLSPDSSSRMSRSSSVTSAHSGGGGLPASCTWGQGGGGA
jgi:hypothetical protein